MKMNRYRNLDGNSGVSFYESGPDFIRLQFLGGSIYRYDYHRPGAIHVEHMKELAQTGRGLSSYLSRHVRDAYALKEA
jgi:hypothetical protein